MQLRSAAVGFLALIVAASSTLAADLNISGGPPSWSGTIGWDPGETYARAIHWTARNNQNYAFYGDCPDDGGVCQGTGDGTVPNYQLDFDMYGQQEVCHPNSNDPVVLPNTEYGDGTCPCSFYETWFGGPGYRFFAAAVNDYSWNRWNSPNMWIGLEENVWRSPTLRDNLNDPFSGRRLDTVLLSFTLNAYLDRNYVQNGVTARGQGRIHIGFTFTGADQNTYVIEMNLSNMQVNMDDGRPSIGWAQSPAIPVESAWFDNMWGQRVSGLTPTTITVGSRNWGFDFHENQDQSIFFDPWFVAVNLAFPPPGQAQNALPMCAIFECQQGNPVRDANGYYVPGDTHIQSFYSGIEMAGSAVHGNTMISNWTIHTR